MSCFWFISYSYLYVDSSRLFARLWRDFARLSAVAFWFLRSMSLVSCSYCFSLLSSAMCFSSRPTAASFAAVTLARYYSNSRFSLSMQLVALSSCAFKLYTCWISNSLSVCLSCSYL